MKKTKLVYGKSYIFGFFFFFVWRILSFNYHSPLVPVSHKFSSFPSHFTVIPLIRFTLISPVIPQFIRFPLISPHSPLIPLSFGFPSFLSFGFSNSPVNPLGFPSFSFPSCIPSSLSAVLSWLFSLGSLSLPLFSLDSLSPFPCSLK